MKCLRGRGSKGGGGGSGMGVGVAGGRGQVLGLLGCHQVAGGRQVGEVVSLWEFPLQPPTLFLPVPARWQCLGKGWGSCLQGRAAEAGEGMAQGQEAGNRGQGWGAAVWGGLRVSPSSILLPQSSPIPNPNHPPWEAEVREGRGQCAYKAASGVKGVCRKGEVDIYSRRKRQWDNGKA